MSFTSFAMIARFPPPPPFFRLFDKGDSKAYDGEELNPWVPPPPPKVGTEITKFERTFKVSSTGVRSHIKPSVSSNFIKINLNLFTFYQTQLSHDEIVLPKGVPKLFLGEGNKISTF
jgi:hypothetical protein